MTNVNMKEIEKVAKEFDYDLLKVQNKLLSIQSKKCRLKKKCGMATYQDEMTKTLQQEEILKQVKQFLDPKEKPVTQYEQSDIDILDYEKTMKAIETIRSKKSNTRWLTTVEGDNDEYRNACKIEEMLLEHKKTVKPLVDGTLRKMDLLTMIEMFESTADISKESMIENLKSLL